jgi:hypothetical protein
MTPPTYELRGHDDTVPIKSWTRGVPAVRFKG